LAAVAKEDLSLAAVAGAKEESLLDAGQ